MKRFDNISILLISLTVIIFFAGFMPAGITEKRKIETDGKLLASDALGNIYIARDYELSKYDKDGNLLYTYSNFLAGNIYGIDAADPFKILVYYMDFSQIDILDNTLSRSAEPILLQVYGLELATLVCRSYNNGIWVYDSQNFELVRLDQQMQISDRTGNISQITGNDINPNYLLESENMVYLNDPQSGILVFDKYGTYFTTYSFTNIKSFQVFDGKIMYPENGELKIFDTQKLLKSSIKQPLDDPLDMKMSLEITPHQLFVLDQTHLYIFVEN